MKIFTIATGILLAVLGASAFFTPIRVFLGLGWLLGILLAINGVDMMVKGWKAEKKDWLYIVLGALEVILGFIILFNGMQRVLTDVMIAYMIGFYLLMTAVLQIAAGMKLHKTAETKSAGTWSIVLGVLSAIVGVMAVGHPVMTMISVGWIIAFNVTMQGVTMAIMGFKLPKKEK